MINKGEYQNSLWLFTKANYIEKHFVDCFYAAKKISQLYNKQLVVICSNSFSKSCLDSFETRNILIDECLLIKNSIEFDEFKKAVMFGEQTGCDSVGVVTDFSRLSDRLLRHCDSIMIDVELVEDRKIEFNASIKLDTDSSTHFNYSISKFEERECSLITSVFNSDDYIRSFALNSEELEGYSNIDHIYLISSTSNLEKELFNEQYKKHRNIILIWHRNDPGLYECWNIGIQVSVTKFVSNANVDDLRAPNHVSALCTKLRNDEDLSVVASALYPFYEYSGELIHHKKGVPWYSDLDGKFGFKDLARCEIVNGVEKLVPNNLPHCMPIWCRSLHEKYGYFNEKTYGTFADWAFWLKVTLAGEYGHIVGEGLGYYFVNMESHNRRGADLDLFHNKIEREFIKHFSQQKKLTFEKKLELHGVNFSYGQHRHGFNKLIESLLPVHDENGKVLFLPFIERYFVWGNEKGEAASDSPRALLKDWVGIIHVPFDAPNWFHSDVYPEKIFETELWQKSLPYCRGIIALSEDLRKDVQANYPNIQTLSLKFPTVFGDVKLFNLAKFIEKPTLVQAGDWLRKLTAIHSIQVPGYRKVMLLKDHTKQYLKREIDEFGTNLDDNVEMLTMVPNDEYDEFLSSSVVICWLFATAANNLVIECIARHTPLIINPLPSVVEYLGAEYPLYINHLSEVDELLKDKSKIVGAHEYLKRLSENIMLDELSYESFFNTFVSSSFYEQL